MDSTGPTSEQEFERDLDELIIQAFRNDVPVVNGGYVFRHDRVDIPDIELMIYRLADSSEATDWPSDHSRGE